LLSLLCGLEVAVAAQPAQSVEVIGEETFQVWQHSGDDFAMYCREPCDAPAAEIQAYYSAFRSYLPALIDWHGVDVVDVLKPVEIHLNASQVCPLNPRASGYAQVSFHRGLENRRGLNCLFEIERGEPLSGRNHVLSMHEYSHLIMFERHRWSYEYFPYWSSWAIVDPSNEFADPCNSFYAGQTFTAPIHELCTEHGLEQADVRTALIELDRRFQAGEGFLSNRSDVGSTTTLAELRSLFDSLTASDTSPAWLTGGWDALEIGMEFNVGGESAIYTASDGLLQIEVPANALEQTVEFRLDKPAGSSGFLPFTHQPRHFAIVPDGGSDQPNEPAVEFLTPIEISIQPNAFFLNNQPLATYDVLIQDFNESGRSFWRPVANSRFDAETGLLHAELPRTGHYAYGPGFQAPSGMFFDPQLSGHGFDIQMADDQIFTTLFTYDSDGDPIWMIGSSVLGNVEGAGIGASSIELYQYQYDEGTKEVTSRQAGTVQFQFFGGWGASGWDLRANADVNLDHLTGDDVISMRLEPLPFGQSPATRLQVSGHWFDPADAGWGLTLDRKAQTEVTVVYFYDGLGDPRWAIGNREIDRSETPLDIISGFCLGCENTGTTAEFAGQITYEFDDEGRSANASLDIRWPIDASTRWTRPAARLVPLSDPPLYRNDPNESEGLETSTPESSLTVSRDVFGIDF